jgi:hypothetical protein
VRDVVVQMTGSNGVLSVPDERLPTLVVLIVVGPVVWRALAGLRALEGPRGRPQRAQGRLAALPFAGRARSDVLIATRSLWAESALGPAGGVEPASPSCTGGDRCRLDTQFPVT